MQNKIIRLLAVSVFVSTQANDAMRSFYSVRPFSDNLMSSKLMLDQEHGCGRVNKQRNIQLNVFGSRSAESDDLARYFFQGKKELIVREAAPADVPSAEVGQDILARDFNINTANNNFISSITIAPRQEVFGANLSLRMYYGKNEQWNFALEIPFMHVKNDMKFEETITGTFTADANTLGLNQKHVVASMAEAFKLPQYGKIDQSHELKETGVGNIVAKLGYESEAFNCDDKYMNMYLGVILPTGNKPKAEYMFEAIVGNNGHAGLMMGTAWEALMKTGKKFRIWSRWNIESRYLFENTQKRSFDLLGNGVWSRYLPMFEGSTQLVAEKPTFGINLLTLDAKVRPGYQANIDMAMCAAGDRWHGSIGLSTHARQGEKIKLANAWSIAPYLVSYFQLDHTNRFRQSGREYAGLDNNANPQVALKENDIDLDSAAHPAAISQTVYMTLGGYTEGEKPRMYEIGASYEYSCLNTSLNRWGVWGTLQISF